MPCNCFIEHARNGYERDAARAAFERARRCGDTMGAIIAHQVLQPCPEGEDEGAVESPRGTVGVAQYGDDSGL